MGGDDGADRHRRGDFGQLHRPDFGDLAADGVAGDRMIDGVAELIQGVDRPRARRAELAHVEEHLVALPHHDAGVDGVDQQAGVIEFFAGDETAGAAVGLDRDRLAGNRQRLPGRSHGRGGGGLWQLHVRRQQHPFAVDQRQGLAGIDQVRVGDEGVVGPEIGPVKGVGEKALGNAPEGVSLPDHVGRHRGLSQGRQGQAEQGGKQ